MESLYKADEDTPGEFPTFSAPSFPLWFEDGNPSNCPVPAPCQEGLFSPDITSGDSTIASTGFILTDYEDAYNWETRRYLYDKLKANPGLSSGNTLMQNFETANNNTSVGLLHDIAEQIKTLYELDSNTANQLASNFADIQAAVDEIGNIDLLLENMQDSVQIDSLLNERKTQSDIIDVKTLSNEQIAAQWLADRTTGADALIPVNNAIVTEGIYDANEKTLNDLYLKTAVKNIPLTLVQKAQIKSIAEQCPYSGGRAVYKAKAWYEGLTGERTVQADCPFSRESHSDHNKKTNLNTGNFSVFPNPGQHYINIEYDLRKEHENARFTLADHTGRMLKEFRPNLDSKKHTLSLEEFPSGIYFIMLWSDKEQVEQKKIVILK